MNAAIAYPPRLRRIALLTDRFVVGGGAEHIYQIARGMPEVEFGIFADGGDDTGRFENLLNVQLFRGGYAPQEVLGFKPDLIHVHHLRPLTRLFLNPLRRYRMPVYFTAHGMHIHQYEFLKGPLNMLKHRLRYQLERYLFHRVDKVVAVSREDCRFIETAYRVRGCEYIPNGIDCRGIENITLGKTALRRELALPENAWLFLTVARFPFQKGHDVLLEAV
ncbi:MAG: glycosyltransferase family 4 protein, partial [Calditrichaeota bacterium]|nr:glycosyltransferase family 4 protein [Calditrichota bacterium]